MTAPIDEAAPAPLRGVRVVELAHWIAGPAAGGVLSDWGADVIKVEANGGDAMRHLFRPAPGSPAQHSPSFSGANRGKRSIEVDLGGDEGRAVLDALLAGADVFLTNLRPGALERLGLAPDAVAARFPALIYCSVTAYGWQGEERDAAGYDLAGFFGRSGVLHQITVRDTPPPPLMNGMGDLFTAMSAVAGILAALHERHHSGRGRFVEASLLRTGMWAVSPELSLGANGGNPRPVADRADNPTPLFNVYRTADAKWFVLVGVEADRHLPAVLAAVGRTDLLDDERFATARAVARNRREFIAVLDECFAARTLEEWAAIFAEHDVWWGPVQSPADVAADPQAHAAGAWSELAGGAGRTIDAPIRFDGVNRTTLPDAPLLGAHTDEILAEINRSGDRP